MNKPADNHNQSTPADTEFAADNPVVVAALYKFIALPDYEALQTPLHHTMQQHAVKGTLLLASEGINGTIAGSRTGIDAVLAYLKQDERFAGLEHKESYVDVMPFHRTKVKLKQEIVTMGVPGTDPNHIVGTHVDVDEWNRLLEDPDTIVIDTRNQYEVDIGTFKNAVSPETTTFREFPEWAEQNLDPDKNKSVAMFCTGGIRCEKSTSYLKSQGFENVFHLNGGILKYLEKVEPEENLWEGECFVFDGRVAVDKNLQESDYEQCFACRHPLSPEELQSPQYEAGICCPYCYADMDEQKRARLQERQKQVQLAKARGEAHIGVSHQQQKAIKAAKLAQQERLEHKEHQDSQEKPPSSNRSS